MMIIIQRGNTPSLHLVSLCFITLKDILSSYETWKKYNEEHNEKKHKNNQAPNNSWLSENKAF